MDGLRDLLSIYYQPSETPEMRARQIALFVKDLAEFSDEAVSWAIDEWRRTQDRRPTPATLRQLCMTRKQEALQAQRGRTATEAIGGPDLQPLSDEERERRSAVIAKAAKAAGFVQNQHGQWQLPQPEGAKPKRIPHWSETAAPDDPRFAELRRARAAAGVFEAPRS